MIEINIPGFGKLKIKYFVMDYNGTLAIDGKLIKEIKKILNELSEKVEIHIITADTFGKAKKELEGVNCKLKILPENNQVDNKAKYINQLGKDYTVAFGNGRNDSMMLKEARLGIALIQDEGASTETLLNSDIVCKNIIDALNLFKNHKRLIATIRV